MKNVCLLLMSVLSLCATAQRSSGGLQATNAAVSLKAGTVDVYYPGQTYLYKKLVSVEHTGIKQEDIKASAPERKTISMASMEPEKFTLIGEVNAKQKQVSDLMKLTVFNASETNEKTGVYSFHLIKSVWKGAPFIYCTNCGTAVLQIKAEQGKKYFVQVSLEAEKDTRYELLTYPNMLSPETYSFPAGAQELFFAVIPKDSGYLTYYLRCVDRGSWHLSRIRVSER